MATNKYQAVLWDGGKNYTISIDGSTFQVVLKRCARSLELGDLKIDLVTPEYGEIVLKDNEQVLTACVRYHQMDGG